MLIAMQAAVHGVPAAQLSALGSMELREHVYGVFMGHIIIAGACGAYNQQEEKLEPDGPPATSEETPVRSWPTTIGQHATRSACKECVKPAPCCVFLSLFR